MNDKTITPLEKLRLEKQILKTSCKKQEENLYKTIDYAEDNLIQLFLGATAKTLVNPSKLASSFVRSSFSGSALPKDDNPLDLISKNVFGYVIKAAFGFAINKKFGKKSVVGKVVGAALATPAASAAWKYSQPYVMKWVKSGVGALVAWKKRRLEQKNN